MLRSEEMYSIAVYLNGNNVKQTVEELGNLNIIQIKEGTNTQENLTLKTIERVEQQLAYLKIRDFEDKTSVIEFKQAASEIDRAYKKMIDLKHSEKSLREKKVSAEETYVMSKGSHHFIEEINRGRSINFVTGIVERDKKFLVKKVLQTTLKRNCYVKMVDVDTKYATKPLTVFIVYVYGEDPERRVREIITTMGGRTLSENGKTLEMVVGIKNDLKKIRKLHKNIKYSIKKNEETLKTNYKGWLQSVTKERRIYEMINKLKPNKERTYEQIDDIKNVFFTGEAWVRAEDFARLKASTGKVDQRFYCEKIKIKEKETVPTYFKLNEFTQGFQNITNVFGVPKYQEINPALFMLFTFPFMFGAMFGDVCHGLILLFMAMFMIRNFNHYNHNCGVLQILLEGRYIVLCCSLASIWFGMLYGDFAGTGLALFKSQYETGRTYPFGIDPIWHHAENSMTFTNSLKMKLSLIIGFVHMSVGSGISLFNAKHFHDNLTFYSVALHQFIAFSLFLGYLVFLCFYKWLVTFDHPSLVETLIGMYTDPFNMSNQMYSGQLYVQIFIVVIIIICIPWMFFTKPIYCIMQNKVQEDALLDLWINSGIHTIEFGLGLISNTSSYLRLWAVSLAHVQLTSVLHQFTIGAGGFLYKVMVAPLYVVATLMLLIGLEGLSSCLHALRLNWIEFFSKFYAGGGVEFMPLTFDMKYEEIYDE